MNILFCPYFSNQRYYLNLFLSIDIYYVSIDCLIYVSIDCLIVPLLLGICYFTFSLHYNYDYSYLFCLLGQTLGIVTLIFISKETEVKGS